MQCLLGAHVNYSNRCAPAQLTNTHLKTLLKCNLHVVGQSTGPSCSNVVSLTSSLRVISLTVLADSIYNILIFFAEKYVSSFCTFFQQTNSAYLRITRCKFQRIVN